MLEQIKTGIRIKSMVEADRKKPTVLIDFPNKTHLIQLRTKTEFSILDDNYKTTHKPFCCKDYFNEIIATELDGKSRRQYGFVSKKLEFDLLSKDTFKLALINNSSVDINKYINGIKLLNQADKNRDYILTTIEETTDNNIIVLNIDTKWLSKPAYFSFYTLLIRLSYNYEGEEFNNYIKEIYPKINSQDKIHGSESMNYNTKEDILIYLFEGNNILQKWEDYLDKSNSILHNNSGMISYYKNIYNGNINKLKEDVAKNTKETTVEV